MAKENKDKIEKLEAAIGRWFLENEKLTSKRNALLQQLNAAANELEKLKQEK